MYDKQRDILIKYREEEDKLIQVRERITDIEKNVETAKIDHNSSKREMATSRRTQTSQKV